MSELSFHANEHSIPDLNGKEMMPEDDQRFYDNGSEEPHEITPWIDHVRRKAAQDGVYDDKSAQSALGGGDYDSYRDARSAPAHSRRQDARQYYQDEFGLSGRPENGEAVSIPEIIRVSAEKAAIKGLRQRGYSDSQIAAICRARDERRGRKP